ncbi:MULTISPECIES: Gfo/Idh/MocA family protein [Clostridium]|uniref:Gfo/Idh/MocA family protein n=1 Tax=Clostridium TaxID=1485 RepID=UPI0018A05300|nr:MULTISPECIES: Gfo/Idh/MocA family oxidoreductase [Clostridium]MBS7131660.1 Gfo/Idh/MocA family oxidoreductase [Clostridium sp.]MDB2076834.1 Gfo/Idh/MocA family oxidoreductase [Clostridium paraputrificum]MDB2079522.1 Gfo/Idh/MocA family oxidoreductase [Clostridium paraputrificum]MDB2094397.1 Gfo/Idh/MocA family oxidoreductase [Clostridium paraputrificum]MDB2100302.1 Gfo/Idh/MocA family oxidoreductase [Clostridium paraputrificum]
MKVGIIGIGDICKKAYLPLITLMDDLEIVLCTRNTTTLQETKSKYKINKAVSSVDDLINEGIECAFIHSSTDSHYDLCKKLLSSGIHVYVDKPISYNLEEALELKDLAIKNNLILKVGFNRRFAPMISSLKNLGEANIVLIQKNRVNLPGQPRIFVYDDFIHVVDTLRFLMNGVYDNFTVDARIEDNLLQSITLKLSNSKTTAIGIMNRINGITEEIVEYMAPGKKAIVRNLTHTTLLENNSTSIKEFGDWENTLHKRGFNSIISSFIDDVKTKNLNYDMLEDSIITHKLCEKILKEIPRN